MKHLGTKKLETERLVLRRFTVQDASVAYKNWTNDEEVTKYLSWQPHKTVEETKQILAQWVQNYADKSFYLWAIVLKETGEPIGTISAVKQDDTIRMVHIGYCIGKAWWNKGFVSEALKVVIQYFFEEVGVNRIESCHDVNNPNSGKVMKKCGMKHEGIKKAVAKNNQGICDNSEYGLIAEEYDVKTG